MQLIILRIGKLLVRSDRVKVERDDVVKGAYIKRKGMENKCSLMGVR